MNNINVLNHYNRIVKVFNKVKILKEELEIRDKKSMGISRGTPNDKQYEGLKSLVLNLQKVTSKTKLENKKVLDSTGKLIDELELQATNVDYVVKELVVDLTKLKNEIDTFDSEKAKDVEEVKKLLRYYVTERNRVKKSIMEAQIKKRELLKKLETIDSYEKLKQLEKEREEKIREIEEQYDEMMSNINEDDMEKIDDINYEMSEIEELINSTEKDIDRITSKSMTSSLQEHKEDIRKIRNIIQETVDVPIELLDTTKIILTALGAVASLNFNKDSYVMSQEGIRKILGDKDLSSKLGEFISVVERSDSIHTFGSQIPTLGTVFSELKLKYENELKSFEEAKENIDEGLMKPLVVDMFKKMIKKTSKYLFKLQKVLSFKRQEFNASLTSVNDSLFSFKDDILTSKKRFAQKAIQMNSEIKKLKYELSKAKSDSLPDNV